MDLRADLSFPAPPDAVVAMLRDPDYVRLRSERTGGSNVTVDVRDEGDNVVITSERTLPTDRFPSIARKFVGDGLTDPSGGPVASSGRRQLGGRLRRQGRRGPAAGQRPDDAVARAAREAGRRSRGR